MKSILTISPKNFPGVTSHFEHLSKTTGMTDHTDHLSPESVKGREIIIFGAWEHTYFLAMKKLREKYDHIKTGLLWTSTIGQVGFSPNLIEVSFLYLISDSIKAEKLDYLFIPTKRVYKALRKIFPKDVVKYMPNTFSVDWIFEEEYEPIHKGFNWVDLFAPSGVRKNVLNQLLGAKLANVLLHVNSFNKPIQDFADLIGLHYVDTGWMERSNYLKMLQTMRLGLQVSYAETFDYVVAEHFAYKIPCLVSKTINYIPKGKLWDNIMIDRFDDPTEIANKIRKIIQDDNLHKKLGKECFRLIQKTAKKNNKDTVKTLKEVLE